jgi:hypothetical protein
MLYVDKRTLAAIASNGTMTYPHGLPRTPDVVLVRWNQTIVAASNVASISALVDASNVSLQNIGGVQSPTMEVCTMVFHSLIV